MGLRGGARPGAGRPRGTGKFNEQTKPIRLPVSSIDHVLDFVWQKCLQIPICLDSDLLKYTDTKPIEKWYLGAARPEGEPIAVKVTDILATKGFRVNDILLVDRKAVPSPGDYIIHSDNGTYSIMMVRDEDPGDVWGVIATVVRNL